MLTREDLKKKIEFQGIKNYILVSEDGVVAARDPRSMESRAEFVRRSGRLCRAAMGSRVRFLFFPGPGGTAMVVFPAGRYSLGIIHTGDGGLDHLIGRVLTCIHEAGQARQQMAPRRENTPADR
jgi:hypothetical protein